MSYGADIFVIDAGRAAGELAVVGAQVAVLGTGAVIATTILAADGALAVLDAIKGQMRDETAAHGTPVQFTALRTGLVSEMLPLFRSALAARQIKFAEGGTLNLANGANETITYTALDPQGRVMFFLRPGSDGMIEVLVHGTDQIEAVERVVGEALFALGRETLGKEGFTFDRKSQDHWVARRNNQDGTQEVVDLVYRDGQLGAEATRRTAQGQLLKGDACPDLRPMLDQLADASFRPLTDSSGRTQLSAQTSTRRQNDENVTEYSPKSQDRRARNTRS